MSSNLAAFNFDHLTLTPLNFNILQDEIHHLIFSMLDPYERAIISSTCKRWNEIIMGTKNYWREVEIQEGGSKEKMMRTLQVFSDRSHNSLIEVKIERLIDTEEELREVFSAIGSSASTIMILVIRENHELDSLTRRLCRSFANLKVLYSTISRRDTETHERKAKAATEQTGLMFYVTSTLDNLQDEEAEWLSKLQELSASHMDSETAVLLILRSCKNLASFGVSSLHGRGDQEPASLKSITLRYLHLLVLPIYPFNQPSLVLKLTLPNLTTLLCRIDQMEPILASSHLEQLKLMLEEEGDGWNEHQAEEYAVKLRRSLSNSPTILRLTIEAPPGKAQIQLQALVQVLLCLDVPDQSPILPDLYAMDMIVSQAPDLTALARSLISRERYRSKIPGSREFGFLISSRTTPQIMEKLTEEKKRLQALEFAE